jgi:hypothetical protein
LPLGTVNYSREYQDELNRVLRLYFQQLGGAFQAYLNEGGGRFLSVPCGAWFSNQAVTFSSNVATVVTLNNTDTNATIDTTLSNGSVQMTYPGIYNYQFSAQLTNSDSQAHDVDIWIRVDGVNVYESASQVTVPSRHGSTNGAVIAAWNFFVTAQANSVIDLVMAANHPDISLAYFPASNSPFVRPSIPTLITTVTFVSRLPA